MDNQLVRGFEVEHIIVFHSEVYSQIPEMPSHFGSQIKPNDRLQCINNEIFNCALDRRRKRPRVPLAKADTVRTKIQPSPVVDAS